MHFEQLIEEIVQLPDINMGVKHLEQVAANIVMIKVWFENVEVSNHARLCMHACEDQMIERKIIYYCLFREKPQRMLKRP